MKHKFRPNLGASRDRRGGGGGGGGGGTGRGEGEGAGRKESQTSHREKAAVSSLDRPPGKPYIVQVLLNVTFF